MGMFMRLRVLHLYHRQLRISTAIHDVECVSVRDVRRTPVGLLHGRG